MSTVVPASAKPTTASSARAQHLASSLEVVRYHRRPGLWHTSLCACGSPNRQQDCRSLPPPPTHLLTPSQLPLFFPEEELQNCSFFVRRSPQLRRLSLHGSLRLLMEAEGSPSYGPREGASTCCSRRICTTTSTPSTRSRFVCYHPPYRLFHRRDQHTCSHLITIAPVFPGHGERNEDTSPATPSGVVATSSHAWPQLATIPTEQQRSRQH
jgi:hypothetical protein